MELIKRADAIAAEAHAGQVDKAGAPYIDHPREVAKSLARAGHDAETCATALLHDVLEDTDVTADDLVRRGIPEGVVVSVVALTFRHFDRNETREEYYARIKRSGPRALAVKRADVAHNRGRISDLPDPADRARLERKYEKAEKLLA